MNKKYIFLAIGGIFFLILTTVFKSDPLISNEVSEKEVKVKETEKQASQELNLIDYYNLEGENRALQDQIDHKNLVIFELYKIIVNSGTLEELPGYDNREIIYKEVSDTEILLLSSEDRNIGFDFSVLTEDKTLWNYIFKLDDSEKINWSADSGLFSGIMQDKEIDKVVVYKNETAYETRIVDVGEGLRLWYAMLDYEAKSMDDELDQMEIQAIDGEGNVLWEVSFENEFDRVASTKIDNLIVGSF